MTADEFPEKSDGKHNLFHPLFLGIRVKEGWKLSKISIKDLLKELSPMGAEVSRGTGAEETKVSFGETENPAEDEKANPTENPTGNESENEAKKSEKKRRKKNDTPKESPRF